jgi:hypothetical protein
MSLLVSGATELVICVIIGFSFYNNSLSVSASGGGQLFIAFVLLSTPFLCEYSWERSAIKVMSGDWIPRLYSRQW